MGLFSTIVSVAVGVGAATLVATTGPIGLAAVIAVKSVSVGAVATGVVAACATKVVLNRVGKSSEIPNIDFLYDTVASAGDKVRAGDVALLVPSPNVTTMAENPVSNIDFVYDTATSVGDKVGGGDFEQLIPVAEYSGKTSDSSKFATLLKKLDDNRNIVIAAGVVLLAGALYLGPSIKNYISRGSKKDSKHSNGSTKKTKASDSEKNPKSCSTNGNNVNSAGAPNDPDRNPYLKKRTCGSEDSSELDDSDANDFESSDSNNTKCHRYKYLDKNFKGRSKYDRPLEIDHIIPMDVWKKLRTKLILFQNNLDEHLIRLKKIFEIVLKDKDIFSLTKDDIQDSKRQFPSMEILTSIHRAQSTTGNTTRQNIFNELMIQSILDGNWDEAIISVFRDQHKLARSNNVSAEERALIRKRQRSFVRYCLRKQIITRKEAENIFAFIKSTKLLFGLFL